MSGDRDAFLRDHLAPRDPGALSLLGVPVVLLPPEVVLSIQRELEVTLGKRAAGGILYRAGVSAGLRGLAATPGVVSAGVRPPAPDLDGMTRLWAHLGLGRMHLVSADPDGVRFELHIERSVLADGYGPATAPVCHLSAGWSAGVLQALTGREYRVEETRCAATGSPQCVLRAGPAE